MILRVHRDASFLSVTKECSTVGGYNYLSDNSKYSSDNGPIHNFCKIIKNAMELAAEAEIGAYFINAQDAVPKRTTIIEMRHPQPPKRIQVKNNRVN